MNTPVPKPWISRNIPLVTFFSRSSTWWLTAFVLLFQYAIHWKHALWWTELPNLPDGTPGEWIPVTLYDFLGAFLTVPAFVGVGVWTWSLIMHLFFRNSIDKDTHDGTFLQDWGNLTPYQRSTLHMCFRVGFWIGICILCSSLAKGAVPDQEARWNSARINPAFSIALDVSVDTFKRNIERYQRITQMRDNGVPETVIFGLHQRESSGNFRCHPHEGSPLTGRTRYVPKGRLPLPAQPPFTFEQSAADAYYVVDRLDVIDWKRVQSALQGIESFNGLGYQNHHPDVPSPYLWSGTSVYRRGKYTGDGHFDAMATDKQLGCAAILLRLSQAGYPVPWKAIAVAAYKSWTPPFDPRY